MTELFNTILANVSSSITISSAILTIAVAVAFGSLITFTYYKTQDPAFYQRSFAMTLLMLPVILSVMILFTGSNIARAFSLAGALSIIRFRSAPGDPKDIGFIFFDVAAGLACGVGLFGYGIVFVLVLCVLIYIVERSPLFRAKSVQKQLKITIPEDLNYQGAFDEILEKYTDHYSLEKIKTTDLGSLFELVYRLSMKAEKNEQEFLNELRCRNGNLNIILSVTPAVPAR
jgi:hypothetical protein